MVDFVFFELFGGTANPVDLSDAQISLIIVVSFPQLNDSVIFYKWPAFLDGFGEFKCVWRVNHSRASHDRVETFNACFKFHISAPKFHFFLHQLHFALNSGKNAFETLMELLC